jgi:hypothetical protein
VGDADDGRLHMFRGHDTEPPQDPRHLFGPAAAVFDVPGWSALAGPKGEWDAAWWGLTARARPFVVPARTAFFPEAGLAVHRDVGGEYLLVTNAAVGTRGFGNHKHNDLLSFEYHVAGRAIIVDPGSFVYTSNPDARNLMRSVVSHSSVAPAGCEPNDFKPEWLFRMFERATPEHVEVAGDGRPFRYQGRHRGYADQGIVVDRLFELENGDLRLTDTIEHTETDVTLEWRFQLAPGVAAEVSNGRVTLQAGEVAVAVDAPPGRPVAIEPAWYSPSYGIRIATAQLVYRAPCRGTGRQRSVFSLITLARPATG